MDAFDAVEDFAAHLCASSRILTQDKSPTARVPLKHWNFDLLN